MDYYNFSKEMQGGYSKLDGTDWYYEAQFWSEMPDLNLGSQAVRDEFDKIVDFWLDLGVDGFRLDAAKEYYSGSVVMVSFHGKREKRGCLYRGGGLDGSEYLRKIL